VARNRTDLALLSLRASRPVAWEIASAPVPYPDAVAVMEERAAAIAVGRARELVWLLEHPPIYTAGTSARPADLVMPERFPVYRTGRGGQFTYHGPGQRVAYVMLDLRRRGTDIRTFVAGIERWLILTLERFGVVGERREDRVGIWVGRPGPPPREDKIAAIGVRVRRWVSLHGISLNVDPDLDHFTGIVPCGVRDHGVTSLADLGVATTMAEVDQALRESFLQVFGPAIVQ
jgi:lipoyl(octanoyl) transferase